MDITKQNAYPILQELEHQAKDCETLQREIVSAMQVVENTPRLLLDHQDPDVCNVLWTIEDVMHQSDKELTVDQAREVLRFLESEHDAEFGINWYAIDNAIEEVLG
jgi:hypothetical protein